MTFKVTQLQSQAQEPGSPDSIQWSFCSSELPPEPLPKYSILLCVHSLPRCLSSTVSHREKAVLGKAGGSTLHFQEQTARARPLLLPSWGEAPGKAQRWGRVATPQTEPTGALVTVTLSYQPNCRLPALDKTERGKQTSLLLRLPWGFMLLAAKLNHNCTHRHLLSPIHGSHGHNLSPRRADSPTISHPSPSGTQAPPARAHAAARL